MKASDRADLISTIQSIENDQFVEISWRAVCYEIARTAPGALLKAFRNLKPEHAKAEDIDDAWKVYVAKGLLIDAIKKYRSVHGVTLKEAKDAVENWRHRTAT